MRGGTLTCFGLLHALIPKPSSFLWRFCVLNPQSCSDFKRLLCCSSGNLFYYFHVRVPLAAKTSTIGDDAGTAPSHNPFCSRQCRPKSPRLDALMS